MILSQLDKILFSKKIIEKKNSSFCVQIMLQI